MEYLELKIRQISSELILDALENGDAIATASDLRRQVIDGWNAALRECGVPDEFMKTLIIAPAADSLEELRAIRESELDYMETTGCLPEDLHA